MEIKRFVFHSAGNSGEMHTCGKYRLFGTWRGECWYMLGTRLNPKVKLCIPSFIPVKTPIVDPSLN